MELKAKLRQEVRARVRSLTGGHRAEASARVCARLQAQSAWEQARSIFLYAPLPDEVDIWPLVGQAIGEGKVVALPRLDPKTGDYLACRVENVAADMTQGGFGIREPASRCAAVGFGELELILVPGVAFDLAGRRLGRGKGYYDRLLALVRGRTCGVAFDEQIVSDIPIEPHDLGVQCLVTPTRWIEV